MLESSNQWLYCSYLGWPVYFRLWETHCKTSFLLPKPVFLLLSVNCECMTNSVCIPSLTCCVTWPFALDTFCTLPSPSRRQRADVAWWEQLVPSFPYSHLSALTLDQPASSFPSFSFYLEHVDGEQSFFLACFARHSGCFLQKEGESFPQSSLLAQPVIQMWFGSGMGRCWHLSQIRETVWHRARTAIMPAVGSRQQPIQCSSQLAPTDSTYEYSILNLILGSLVLLNSGLKCLWFIKQSHPV